ncbi:cytochrome d ubiquinol oxidase subunit II [Candidatus Rickettsiella viridis]|uniref:Cytochrome d ubiquinol oxidase subunit II n=1 Tax=Candidatus Rickettsiella viridis TaxID=676208 RepID=A0A2Z5UUP8_9COXI|nr:cytochrome d ubiquinol oxidase subunit II [Candidatus Rickettsiella viridis]BBB14670.1 cytochrome d ubiquinol oxidase subunit II [Candidatus Rickettsiella viridis]
MLLILTWAVIISFIIMMYVLLDGFDLGIGILFPWIKHGQYRDIMMSTVLPVWDGNETWLVFGAAALYGAFPLAYSVLLPTLYIPIMILLVSLIFRGVAFEFRFKAQRSQFVWDIAFAAGSTVAAFIQGVILGTFVKGYGSHLPLSHAAYQWLTPFSVFTGLAVVCGYALLGATWLIVKTEGKLQDQLYKAAKILLGLVTFFLVGVSFWTPFIEPRVVKIWFTAPKFYYLSVLPLLTLVMVLYNFYCLYNRKKERAPFVLTMGLFICSYIGFCISAWPYIIPHAVSVWDAAAAPSTLKFTLVGTAILLPILLIYTLYSYHVFRGKVKEFIHY